MEERKGMLKPGYLADVVILDGDIAAVSHDRISSLRAVKTICDGRVTHSA